MRRVAVIGSSAAAPLIESTQAQITSTFSGQTLSSQPGVMANEGLDNIALYVPGVASVRDNQFADTNGGEGFSVNGLRGRNNDQQIDGQNNNDNSVAGPYLTLSDPEWTSQYVLVTNNFGPEYGRNAGSVVNVLTKQGGNAWHGSVYGNYNNSIYNSMTNFQKNFDKDALGNPLTQPPTLNDTFSGIQVGGPVIKNKVFVSGGFNNEIINVSNPFTSGGITPTPAGLATLAACFPSGVGAQAVAAGMLRGLHDTTVPMVYAGIGYWGIGLPLGMLLAFHFGFAGVGIWIGLSSGLAVVAVLLLARWLRRDRIMPLAAA